VSIDNELLFYGKEVKHKSTPLWVNRPKCKDARFASMGSEKMAGWRQFTEFPKTDVLCNVHRSVTNK
jgi:hypothetical protein